jgi:ABC-type antimicrobial peptide transport system permease subunit
MTLSPLNQRRWANFKANRRAFWSLWLFLLLFGLSLIAEVLANDKPIVVSYRGQLYFPIYRFYPETAFGGDFKTEATYRQAFARHGTGADQAMMVGNSLKSDVIPALAAGSWGVHVPHEHEWSYEAALAPTEHRRFHMIADLGDLPDIVEMLQRAPHS